MLKLALLISKKMLSADSTNRRAFVGGNIRHPDTVFAIIRNIGGQHDRVGETAVYAQSDVDYPAVDRRFVRICHIPGHNLPGNWPASRALMYCPTPDGPRAIAHRDHHIVLRRMSACRVVVAGSNPEIYFTAYRLR